MERSNLIAKYIALVWILIFAGALQAKPNHLYSKFALAIAPGQPAATSCERSAYDYLQPLKFNLAMSLLSESDLEERFGQGGLRQFLYMKSWEMQIACENDLGFYRGMRLRPADVLSILKDGMSLSKSRHPTIQFVDDAGYAATYGLYPGAGTFDGYADIPRVNFMAVVFEANPLFVHTEPAYGHTGVARTGIRISNKDLPPEAIKRMWIYDKDTNTYVEFR